MSRTGAQTRTLQAMSGENLQHLFAFELTNETDTYLAPGSAEDHVRAFGGRTVAQALRAAQLTVPDRRVHSCHGYFLRPGVASDPMTCRVHRIRDGASFSNRRVEALQDGLVIFEMLVSFHNGERGPEHTDTPPMIPAPETLIPFEQRFAGRTDMDRWFHRAAPFDIRYVDTNPFETRVADRPARQQLWMRLREPTDDIAALAYASDMTILDAVLLRHQLMWTDRAMLGASLDHSLYLHAPIDFSQWLLFDQTSTVGTNGRILATAQVWENGERFVATITQEALMRPLPA